MRNGKKVYILTPDSDQKIEECPEDECTCGCPGECKDAKRRHSKEKGKGSHEKGKGKGSHEKGKGKGSHEKGKGNGSHEKGKGWKGKE
jgi:hypothetical protein